MPQRVPEQLSKAIETLYRSESGRILAALVHLLGDLDLAEEAMHEAFAAALDTWRQTGIPLAHRLETRSRYEPGRGGPASASGKRVDPVLEERQSRDFGRSLCGTKEQLGGILVLQARGLNHAIQLISRHPGLKFGPWEIRPAADLNEMMKESEQRRKNTAR